MDSRNNIKGWRSEELAKLSLLKSSHKLVIESFPTPLFDFLVTLKDKPKNKFAVEVKTKLSFLKNIRDQSRKIKIYRESGMINIPVLLLKIDDLQEEGEIDFLVLPSKTGKLLIRQNFKFKPLTKANIDKFIDDIIEWTNQYGKTR